MKDLLTYIAQNLVEHPQAVDVQETETDGNVVLELRVDPSDMGKVIGRQGRIAKEIRTLMRSVAQRQGKKVSVESMDGRMAAQLRPPFFLTREGGGSCEKPLS